MEYGPFLMFCVLTNVHFNPGSHSVFHAASEANLKRAKPLIHTVRTRPKWQLTPGEAQLWFNPAFAFSFFVGQGSVYPQKGIHHYIPGLETLVAQKTLRDMKKAHRPAEITPLLLCHASVRSANHWRFSPWSSQSSTKWHMPRGDVSEVNIPSYAGRRILDPRNRARLALGRKENRRYPSPEYPRSPLSQVSGFASAGQRPTFDMSLRDASERCLIQTLGSSICEVNRRLSLAGYYGFFFFHVQNLCFHLK